MSLGVGWTFQTISRTNIVAALQRFGEDYYLADMGYYWAGGGDLGAAAGFFFFTLLFALMQKVTKKSSAAPLGDLPCFQWRAQKNSPAAQTAFGLCVLFKRQVLACALMRGTRPTIS